MRGDVGRGAKESLFKRAYRSVSDNIYFGGNINYLQGLSGLDDLKNDRG